MKSWLNEKGFLGVRKGIWLLDLFGACACGLIVWVLHVKPIVDSMVAIGRAHDIAFDIMAESHNYFVTSNGVHIEDLNRQ
ncbi:hypothetical protein [Neptuniibacter sp. QD37_11]|uniref:hypothetical protein n=1 Tax=Neptuniibacter sp. QD37_11 TaxID=3398209 RepID=UPI0039F46607